MFIKQRLMTSALLVQILLFSYVASGKVLLKNELSCSSKAEEFQEWCTERDRREGRLTSYYKNQSEGLDAFVSGANRHGPGFVPTVMFSVFTELFPEIWGSDDSFLVPGLTKNVYSDSSKIPLGMAVSKPSEGFPEILGSMGEMSGKSINMNLVGFNCAACHSGVVKNDLGEIKTLLGAPNTRINNLIFLMAKTSLSENFTALKFREILEKKGEDWNIYGDPGKAEQSREEIDFFLSDDVAENWVARIQASGKRTFGAFKAFIEPSLYGNPIRESAPAPLAPKRGTLDAFYATFFAYIGEVGKSAPASLEPLERVSWIREQLGGDLPSQPAETDNPSIFSQRDRGHNHWGGEFGALLPRNLSTAVGGLPVPSHYKNVIKVTDFTLDLPPPPYPFEVNMVMARRGGKLFKQNCASCHSGKNKYYPAESVGTSMNRAQHLGKNALSFLQGRLKEACDATGSQRCKNDDGSPYRPEDIAKATQGYQADRLDGIWARAPYGHNGSIPTLEALLVPSERPNVFYRGSLDYDKEKVGFSWDKSEPGVTVVYDTQLEGNSNQGHANADFLGTSKNGAPMDWKSNGTDLKDILEYLKTL